MTFLYVQQPTGTDIVSLADMKQFLRVDHSDEDATITAIIDAATQSIQDYTGRHFKTTTWTMSIDSFYDTEFPYQINTVTSVAYIDTAGATQTLDSSKYYNDPVRNPGRIKFKNTPELVEDKFNRVAIQGGVVNSINPPLTHAIKMLAAHYYENRRAVVVGTITAVIPLGIKAIINPYRIISLK